MIEGLKQIKVLLVDDDENYTKITEMYLADNGLNIKSMNNPKEALKVCKDENIDIVLLDYFMPELTGEEFVNELRKFNRSALVILQTGFSEKKPPIETLTGLDIQGYHDKTKGVDELLLLTLSAIKTMKLIKVNRLQEIKINSLNYKKQLIGELSIGLLNEAKNQLLSISAANSSIKLDTSDYEEENALIEKAHNKLSSVFSALGFEATEVMSFSEVKDTILELLESKRKEELLKLNIEIDSETAIIKNNCETVIFLIVQTMLQLIKYNEKEITVKISGTDVVDVKFEPKLTIDNDFTKQVILILTDKNGVKFKVEEGKAEIISEN